MTIINTLNASGVAKVIAGEEKPTSFPAVYPAPDGYDGWSKMTIEAPDNLTADNIKKDVEIAGVKGTYEGGGSTSNVAEIISYRLSSNSSTGHSTAVAMELDYDEAKAFFDIDSIPDYAFYMAPISKLVFHGEFPSTGGDALARFVCKPGNTPLTVEGLDTKTFNTMSSISEGFLDYCVFSEFPPITVNAYLRSMLNYATFLTDSVSIPEGIKGLNSDFMYYAKFGSWENYFIRTAGTIILPSTITSIYMLPGGVGSSDKSYAPTIRMLATTPPTLSYAPTYYYWGSIVVPAGCADAYKSATNWANYADIITEASE